MRRRRLASPFGRGGTAYAVTERVSFSYYPLSQKSRIFASSPKGGAKLVR